MWLLDSNACVVLLNNSSDSLAGRLAEQRPSEILLCSVVKGELLYGARKSDHTAANLRLLDAFFSRFSSLPFDDRCAEQYATIRHDLERGGTPIGPNDLMIAAISMANGAVLVTHNVREFERVVGLKFEDWE